MIDLLQHDSGHWIGPSAESVRSFNNLLIERPSVKSPFKSVAEARKALTNGHTTEHRVAAIGRLAAADDEFSTATLVAALFDSDDAVQRAATQALSQSRDPDVSRTSVKDLFGKRNGEQLRSASAVAVADSTHPSQRRITALATIASLKLETAFQLITDCLEDESADVRAAAVLALREFDADRMVQLLIEAVTEASPTRRLRVAEAIQASGLGSHVIDELSCPDRNRARAALSLLLLMAEMNAVRPIIEAIEHHNTPEVRRALVRILNRTGKSTLAEAAVKRRLGIPPSAAKTIAF